MWFAEIGVYSNAGHFRKREINSIPDENALAFGAFVYENDRFCTIAMPAHMNTFCVVKIPDANGDYLVHRSDCTYMPETPHCEGLGMFAQCNTALSEAKRLFIKANGCRYCVPECHEARTNEQAKAEMT